MRRRLHTGRGGAVVTARAIGVGRGVGELAARPADERRGRAGVTGLAVAAIGGNVVRERRRALRARRSLAGECAVVAGVAAAGTDRPVTCRAHRIGHKARRRIGVAAAALDARHRHVRRRLHAGCGGAVVAARTVGVGRRMDELAARPAGEGRGRTGVTADAVAPAGRNMVGEGCGTDCARRTLAGECPVMAGVAAAGADGPVTCRAHRVGDKTRCRVGVAVAALNARHRDMRRRFHAGRFGAVMAARAIGVGGGVGELARPTSW